MKNYLLALTVFGQFFAANAIAANPTLRADVTVQNEIVTLADLVENAGDAGTTQVFRAPDLGTKGNITAWQVVEAAQKAGLKNIDTQNISSVSVTRAARSVRADHVNDLIQAAIADKLRASNVNLVAVNFDAGTPNYTLEASSKAEPTIARIDYNQATQRFDAAIVISDSRMTTQNPLIFRGTAVEMVNVVKLLRPINKGANIAADDFEVEAQPKVRVAQDAIIDVKMLDGMSAKRPISAGFAVRMSDLEKAKKVQKNEMVTLIFEAGGISLSSRGKAMNDGGQGDTVAVQNLQTKKILEGKVAGIGVVTIEPAFVASRNRTAQIQRTKLSLKE